MKTIQQDLKSNNLSLNEAIDMAENRPLWRLMSMFGTTHSSLSLIPGRGGVPRPRSTPERTTTICVLLHYTQDYTLLVVLVRKEEELFKTNS